MKFIALLLFMCIPLLGTSQSVKGFVYDAESTVKGAKLLNVTQNALSYSDDKGYFQINAKINDTLLVSSYFHASQSVILTEEDFGNDMVIELKKITTELEQVDITNAKTRKFDSLQIQQTTARHGQIAFKERVIGSGENLQPTLDVIKLAKLIGKLFKKEQTESPKIKTKDLLHLFETSKFFNTQFLEDELGIPKSYEYLFFEYIQAQEIPTSYLSLENEFLLLDYFLLHSKTFKTFLTEYQDD